MDKRWAHEVRLRSRLNTIRPFVKTNKNDAADAEAILPMAVTLVRR